MWNLCCDVCLQEVRQATRYTLVIYKEINADHYLYTGRNCLSCKYMYQAADSVVIGVENIDHCLCPSCVEVDKQIHQCLRCARKLGLIW
jgi:hypothetical protein